MADVIEAVPPREWPDPVGPARAAGVMDGRPIAPATGPANAAGRPVAGRMSGAQTKTAVAGGLSGAKGEP